MLWVKRKHEELKKNDRLRSCPCGIVFNLRFTDQDEVKCRVQKVHPKEHVNTLIQVFESWQKSIRTLSECETSSDEFGAPTSKNSSNEIFFLSIKFFLDQSIFEK